MTSAGMPQLPAGGCVIEKEQYGPHEPTCANGLTVSLPTSKPVHWRHGSSTQPALTIRYLRLHLPFAQMSTATAIYIGSLDDVHPVEQYPAFNWVFVTPEPRHPAAVKHWPLGCPGNHFLDGQYFFESISKRLGAWQCESQSGDDRWIFEKDGRRLTVFVNSAVGGNYERLSEEAKRALAEAKALYVHGWLPTLGDVRRLCPNLQKIISPPGLIAEWGVDIRTMLGCELVRIKEYDWDPDRQEYLFFDQEIYLKL